MTVPLRDLHVRYRDYDADNPPLLHQKDQLLLPDYPHYEKFAKLSQQERNWGLLDDVRQFLISGDGSNALRSMGRSCGGIGWCGERMLMSI
jgi:hypothetical protein